MDRQMMIMKNSLIRGTIGMLNDETRMERKEEARNYLNESIRSETIRQQNNKFNKRKINK
jgi:hypothetical protein